MDWTAFAMGAGGVIVGFVLAIFIVKQALNNVGPRF